MKIFSRFIAAALSAAAFFHGAESGASGYLLNEYSVTSMGRAFAGTGVVGDDISAIASNPAGLQLFDRKVGAQVGVTVITLNGNMKGSVTTPFSDFNGTDSTKVQIQEAVPNFFAAYSVTDKIKVGFGVYVPFGLGTEYPESSIMRLSAIKSDLQVIELAPSVSFNIWRGLTIGGTVNVQRASAKLTQDTMIPTGVQQQPYITRGTELSGDDWSAGGTVGIMYDFGETSIGETTRLGLSYRSQVRHKIKGNLTVAGFSMDASAVTYLPNVVTLSGYHKFKAPVGLSATLRYIQWSIFDELDIQGSGNPRIHEDWRDTVSAHIGVDWFLHEAVTLRAGLAYDMTPIRDAEHRTARIPDNDRILLSAGISAMPHKNWTIDIGYTHMFLQNASINHTYQGVNVNGRYKYDTLSYLVGVQVQYKF